MDIRPLAGLAARCVLAAARRPHVGERRDQGGDADHDDDGERPQRIAHEPRALARAARVARRGGRGRAR